MKLTDGVKERTKRRKKREEEEKKKNREEKILQFSIIENGWKNTSSWGWKSTREVRFECGKLPLSFLQVDAPLALNIELKTRKSCWIEPKINLISIPLHWRCFYGRRFFLSTFSPTSFTIFQLTNSQIDVSSDASKSYSGPNCQRGETCTRNGSAAGQRGWEQLESIGIASFEVSCELPNKVAFYSLCVIALNVSPPRRSCFMLRCSNIVWIWNSLLNSLNSFPPTTTQRLHLWHTLVTARLVSRE